jgi:hypothetical protein
MVDEVGYLPFEQDAADRLQITQTGHGGLDRQE